MPSSRAGRLANRDVAELLARAADDAETDQRRRALRRAARAALLWPEEAADLHAAGRPLSELRFVGPWLARVIGACSPRSTSCSARSICVCA